MKALFISIFIIVLCGCNKMPRQSPHVDYSPLRSLRVESAVNDARRAAQARDYRFLVVYGFGAEVLGVETPIDFITTKFGLHGIEQTSDCPENAEHAMLIENARIYAERYNRELESLLKGLGYDVWVPPPQ